MYVAYDFLVGQHGSENQVSSEGEDPMVVLRKLLSHDISTLKMQDVSTKTLVLQAAKKLKLVCHGKMPKLMAVTAFNLCSNYLHW